ncbi:MAG: SDR family NAD(P)-dependent oxidoreductase, partial [Novosphingobium sp.]|nr:SDR family NAD(P)-dependent oxidoreductase [Novosphingobium sp.]
MTQGFDFSGKTVLITGGTRGLGRAMAQGFAEAGAQVIVSSRKAEACEATAAELRQLGARAEGIACHVGEWDQVDALAEKAWAAFDGIDVL